MAFERLSAFQLYVSDIYDLIKNKDNTVDEALVFAEKEWNEISNDIKFFYIKKEMDLNHQYIVTMLQKNYHKINNVDDENQDMDMR
jgi:hypothetical protein